MTVNVENAKKTWEAAGLNEAGTKAVHAWIEQLAHNVNSNPGRWGAYARFANCETSDYMGAVKSLKLAVDETSK